MLQLPRIDARVKDQSRNAQDVYDSENHFHLKSPFSFLSHLLSLVFPTRAGGFVQSLLRPRGRASGPAPASGAAPGAPREWWASLPVDGNGTVIATASDCPYLDFALNWITHVRKHHDNWVVIAEDDETFRFVEAEFPGHAVSRERDLRVAVPSPPPASADAGGGAGPSTVEADGVSAAGVSGEISLYNRSAGSAFVRKTCRRPQHLRPFLERGVGVLWVDADAAPTAPLGPLPADRDLVLSHDFGPCFREKSPEDGSFEFPEDSPVGKLKLCTCLMLVRPTPGALRLLGEWERDCEARGVTGQISLNALLSAPDGPLSSYVTLFAEKRKFPSGRQWERCPGDRGGAQWVHANWRAGAAAKREFLRGAGAWDLGPADGPAGRLPRCGGGGGGGAGGDGGGGGAAGAGPGRGGGRE